MIKSGLVEQNYGYGTFPAARRRQRWGNEFVEQPNLNPKFDTGFSGITNSAYQPSYVKAITPKSVTRPFQNDITPKTVNPPTFGPTTYDQVFGKKKGDIVDYVAERIKGGEYFQPIGPSQVTVTKVGPVVPSPAVEPQSPISLDYTDADLSDALQSYLNSVGKYLAPSAKAEVASQLPQLNMDFKNGRLSETDVKNILDETMSSSTSSYASALGSPVSSSTSSYFSALGNVETEPFSVFQPTEFGGTTIQATQRVFEPLFKTAQLVPIGQALQSSSQDSELGLADLVKVFKDFQIPKMEDWKPVVDNSDPEVVQDFIDDVKEADFKKEQERKRLLEALKNYLEIVKKFESIENWQDRYEAIITMDEGDQLIIFNLLKNDQDLYDLLGEELLGKSLPYQTTQPTITELQAPLRMKRIIQEPWLQGKTVKRRTRGPKPVPVPIETSVPKVKGPAVRPSNIKKPMDSFITLKRGTRRRG